MVEEEKVTEMMTNVLTAQKEIKGYKFSCVGKFKLDNVILPCPYCKNQLVTFVTTDIDEACRHGIENNMPMWIHKDG